VAIPRQNARSATAIDEMESESSALGLAAFTALLASCALKRAETCARACARTSWLVSPGSSGAVCELTFSSGTGVGRRFATEAVEDFNAMETSGTLE